MHRSSAAHCTAQAVRFIGRSRTRMAAIASAVDGSSQAFKPPPIVRQQPGPISENFALPCFTEPEAAAVVTMCTTIITTRIRAVRIDACGLTTLMPFNGLCDEVMEWIVRWIGRACAVRGEAAR